MADNYFGITDPGKMRSNNEDTFIAQTVMEGRLVAACVIDGVGGYEGGEVAAQLSQEAIIGHLDNAAPGDVIAALKGALSAANEAIFLEKTRGKGKEQMACVLTLALADIPNNKFYYAHVGDTRLYLLRDRSLVKVSRDHSFVGFLEDSGRLSEEDAMRHPKRNEINKALGFDSQIRGDDYIETGESPFLPGDILLLCSDGLSDLVTNNGMTTILTSNKTLAARGKLLVQAANEAGGKDNITVVLVHNNKTPLKQKATKPIMSDKKIDEQKGEESADGVRLQPEQQVVITKKNKRSIVPFLVFLCILLVAAVAWLVYQNYYNYQVRQNQLQNNVVEKRRNPREQLLIRQHYQHYYR